MQLYCLLLLVSGAVGSAFAPYDSARANERGLQRLERAEVAMHPALAHAIDAPTRSVDQVLNGFGCGRRDAFVVNWSLTRLSATATAKGCSTNSSRGRVCLQVTLMNGNAIAARASSCRTGPGDLHANTPIIGRTASAGAYRAVSTIIAP